jgi:hypothetical protein
MTLASLLTTLSFACVGADATDAFKAHNYKYGEHLNNAEVVWVNGS